MTITHEDVGTADPIGWPESFLSVNRQGLARLSIEPAVRAERGRAVVDLHSGDRLGAIPLQSPVTQKVAAGLLVSPKFGWSSVGHVLSEVGYRVEPDVGGAALVPGSAREVPPWVLAGPVVARLASAIERLTRTFVPTTEERQTPRGLIDWAAYARRAVPTGRWTSFLCSYSDLSDDPELQSAMRWALRRVAQDLEQAADSLVARRLLERIANLLVLLKPGPARRPGASYAPPALATDWLRLAMEAIAWVSDERGLGGSRSLDGLPWSLPVSGIWEARVESFLASLALRLGGRLSTARQGSTHRPLIWRTGPHTIGHLAPDFMLELPGRVVWVDAKYKDHFQRLAFQGWERLDEKVRDAHRSDLHQALAYALLEDAPAVDTMLAYPRQRFGDERPIALAELTAGHRQIRFALAAIPFAFEAPADRESTLSAWERHLRAAA